MANTSPQTRVPSAAAWSPLTVPVFRTVSLAVLTTNIGGWMASAATAWLNDEPGFLAPDGIAC